MKARGQTGREDGFDTSFQTEIVKKLTRYFAHCPYPVILAYLFGSHARGKTASLSDIDVAVLLDEEDSLESALIIYSDDRI